MTFFSAWSLPIREGLPTTVQNRWILVQAADPLIMAKHLRTMGYLYLFLALRVRSQRDSLRIGDRK